MPIHLHHRTRATALAAALAGTAALVFASTALATFPGRNGAIAFSAQTDQGVQLFTVGKDGRGLHQISHVAGDAVHPDWSPDGRRIVFELDTEETVSVAFVNPDGSGLAVLPAAPGSLSERQPSYTPVGRRIVFSRFDGAEEATWSMRLSGTDRRRITGGPQGANDPNVSPDGRKVSFVGSRDGVEYAQALFTVRLDGTGVKRLTPFFEPERRNSPLSCERLSPGCPRAAMRCRV